MLFIVNKNLLKTMIKIINNLSKLKNKFNLESPEFSKIKDKVSTLKNKIPVQSTKIINPLFLLQSLQDKVENVFKNKTNYVFLTQSKFWAQSITWALMGGTAFVIGWISIAKTDEVVIAMGKLEPKGGVIDVQIPVDGVVREILIEEGERVKKGQLLMRLDTEITRTRNDTLQNNLEIQNMIAGKLENLVKEGAVPELQYLEQQLRIEQIKSEIKTNLVQLKYKEIISPIDGMVFELLPKGPGFVGRTSQPVLQIVPVKNLIAKVEIDSRTIGYVKPGKFVEISIDSFPSSDFGVIEGKVSKIGSDALPPNPAEGKGYRFPADITLDSQFIKLKTGQKLPLQTGMSLTANIKLRKVTYLKLLLNKFGDKAGSLKSI